jgi:hypothetical protein
LYIKKYTGKSTSGGLLVRWGGFILKYIWPLTLFI